MSEPLPLTAGQVRAARALLAWSQKDLATRADIAVSTVADFERGQQSRTPSTAEALRKALATAKISFALDGEVIGPAPRAIGSTTQSGTPLRWVNATDLAQWADRRDGQSSLPALLAKLVWAAGGAEPHFPADEGVQHSGWDGLTRATTGSAHIPAGASGWEIGTQREGIRGKAEEVYNNRTKQPHQLTPSESTFIFVTPRYWSRKDDWAAKKRAEGQWRDVRVYDGTTLVDWIALYPAIGHELAVALGKLRSCQIATVLQACLERESETLQLHNPSRQRIVDGQIVA